MKLTDIIALAKAGYTPADVKELVALESATESNAASMLEDKTEGVTEPVNNDPAPVAPEVDYKALYEAEKKKLEDIQAAKTKQEVIESEITIDSIVKDISDCLK